VFPFHAVTLDNKVMRAIQQLF